MTGDLINLRRERKRRARTAAEAAAEANRIAHGVNGADKRLARDIRAQADRRLDAHRLADDDPLPPTPRD